MSLKFLLFVYLVLFFFSLTAAAQNFNCSVEGKVISQSSGKPLENVNVFITNTVWGTTTNKEGYFKIKSLPFGNLTVAASMVGYKSKTASIILKERENLEVNFNLEEKSYETNQVLVTGKVPKDWAKNLKVFKKYFLGDGPNADECKILNPEVINLTKTVSGDLTANSSQPIMIINNALGYKVRCELDNFEWNKENSTFQYAIKSYYTELKDSMGNLESKWTKNRDATYYGSITDFIKSLMDNTYQEEGFRVYKLPLSKYNPANKSFYELDKPVIKKINNNYAELNFKGYLRVEYDSDTNHKTEVSWIKLSFPDVLVDKFGYEVVPYSITAFGYWAYSGFANMLPKYYNPQNN